MNDIVTTAKSLGFVQTSASDKSDSVEVEKAIAEIKAQIAIAKMYPRDEQYCVQRIINACQRTALAEQARYTFSRGGTEITGPTIRMIESVAQNWQNIKWGWEETERRDNKSMCRAYAWDLENNIYREMRFDVPHYRDTRNGRKPIKEDRDIYEHCSNMATRRMRTCLMNVIPGDVIELAQVECDRTLANTTVVTQDSVKKLLDVFKDDYGVTRQQIEKRIQRSAESMTPGQMSQLRRVYAGLRDGMGVVSDYFQQEQEKGEEKGTAALKQKLSKKNDDSGDDAFFGSMLREINTAPSLDALADVTHNNSAELEAFKQRKPERALELLKAERSRFDELSQLNQGGE